MLRDTHLFDDTHKLALESRPTYQYCYLLQETLRVCQPYIKKETSLSSLFGDGLDSVRSPYQVLSTIVNSELEPQMRAEELKRPACGIPIDLYHDLGANRKEAKEIEDKIEELEKGYRRDKEALKDRKTELLEILNKERLEKVHMDAKNIERDALYRQYNEEYKKLEKKQDLLNAKIASTCCHFFSSCVAKENAELKKIDQDMIELTAKLKEVSPAPEEKKVSQAEMEFNAIDGKTEILRHEYIANFTRKNEQLDSIRNRKKELELRVQEQKNHHFNQIDKEHMLTFVRSYISFDEFLKSVEAAWTHKFSEEKKSLHAEEQKNHSHPKDTFAKLNGLREKLREMQSKLAPFVTNLHCPYSGNRNLDAICKRLEERNLSLTEKRDFLEGKLNVLLINQLIPYEKITPIRPFTSDQPRVVNATGGPVGEVDPKPRSLSMAK